MRAIAERELPVWRTVDVEPIRVREDIFVAVAGGIAEHHPIVLLELAATEFCFFGSGAHEGLHRRRPADRFFDQRRNERGIGFDALEQTRLRGERPHRASGGR
mgnify:CR=1 FL=1